MKSRDKLIEEWSSPSMKEQRDASGNLTSLALAINALEDHGCDCGTDEPGTCLACLCEAALRSQWEAQQADKEEIERMEEGLTIAYMQGRADERDTLQKQNAELREGLEKAHKALEPFARQAPHIKELYATEAWMAKKADFYKAWDTWDKITQLLTPQPKKEELEVYAAPLDKETAEQIQSWQEPKKEECPECDMCGGDGRHLVSTAAGAAAQPCPKCGGKDE